MSEHVVISNPVVLKLIGVIATLSIAFLGYEHQRISKLRATISHVDDRREDNCMTKEQCSINRDYQEKLFKNISDGNNRIETRINSLFKEVTERRKDD